MSRKALAIGLACVVGAGVVVAGGRVERGHAHASTLRGIDAVWTAIGSSLTRPGPKDYRSGRDRMCLLYAAGERVYALELCTDPSGRVIEAVDRRGTTSKFYSLVAEPKVARLHVDPRVVDMLVKKLSENPSKSVVKVPLNAPCNEPFYRVVLAHVTDAASAATVNSRAVELVKWASFGVQEKGPHDFEAQAWFCWTRGQAVRFERAIVKSGFFEKYGYPPPVIVQGVG